MLHAVHVPTVTVCLPVYNVAPWLRRCLESIRGQTFRDFAVIAVDDGSTDESPAILREFAAQLPMRVIRQENQGLSAARNCALSLVRSEYVCFVDSDDFLAPTYLEELLTAIRTTGADVACCSFTYEFFPSGRRWNHPLRCRGVFSREEALNRLLHDWSLQSYAWNKLYRTDLFREHGITYPAIRYFEDLLTTPRLFFYAKRVVVLDRCLYGYVQRKSGATKQTELGKINDFLRAVAGVRIFLEQTGEFDRFARGYAALCRKTDLWCKIFLLHSHAKRHDWHGFFRHCRLCSGALRRFQRHDFPQRFAGNFLDCLRLPNLLREQTESARTQARFARR